MIYVDQSRWFPRKRGTVKQWRPGRRCRAHAMRNGTGYCWQHQEQRPIDGGA